METALTVARIIGANIRRLRREKKVRARELASNSRISRSYLYDIEKGRVAPSLRVLLNICDVLQCEPQELLRPQADERKAS